MTGEQIKAIRTEAGLSQAGFARFVGCSLRAIQSWEQGDRECPEWTVGLIRYKAEHEGLIAPSYDHTS